MDELSDIIQNIAVIVGCVTAIYGLDTWRREFYSKKRFELAEEVLPLFYEARDAIRAIRNPGSFGYEGKTRTPEENETPEQTEALNQAYIVFERYNNHKAAFNNLFAKKYRFMAIFGTETESHFNAIQQILNSVFIAARHLGTYYWPTKKEHFFREEAKEQHFSQQKKYEDVFWGLGDEDDKTDQKLVATITAVEAVCRKELYIHPTLWKKILHTTHTTIEKKRDLLSNVRFWKKINSRFPLTRE